MTLSICLLASDPPARVAAALEPVRDAADEVVIAADSRVDQGTLAGYAALADRLFRVEFRLYERHLGWLHAQCSGDWILRLDGDEVPSAAFARRLPELIASRAVRQYHVRRAWLFGDTVTVLEDEPWISDHLNRLVRNDGSLRFPGGQHQHAVPAAPAEWIDEPVYHLELLVNDVENRRDKAVRYEVAAPHVRAAGGGRINEAFYLPELRESIRRGAVPDEDQALLGRALAAAPEPAAAEPGPVPIVSLKEMDRYWDGRLPAASARLASIGPLGLPCTMEPGEVRALLFRVANRGDERWPWGLDQPPAIRMTYRWLAADGSVVIPEGLRTPFPRTVEPGDEVLVPVHVEAPATPGRHVLEVDVVHEGVSWFGVGRRVEIEVRPATHLPPAGERLVENEPRRGRLRSRSSRLRIPRLIHRVWVGGAPMPAAHAAFGDSFARLHPDWELRLWSDDDLAGLGIDDAQVRAARWPSELANLVRYVVLERYGGLYVDTDVECKRPFDELLGGVSAFAGLEAPGRVGTAVLGSVPGHRAFARAAATTRRTLGVGAHSADANGPYLLSLIFEQEADVTVFGAGRFYPYRWDEPERARESFPDAYAVHHWALSWWSELKA